MDLTFRSRETDMRCIKIMKFKLERMLHKDKEGRDLKKKKVIRAGLPQKATMSRIRERQALGEVGRRSHHGSKHAGAFGTGREAGRPGQQ